jgi:hypothetical protein
MKQQSKFHINCGPSKINCFERARHLKDFIVYFIKIGAASQKL